MSVQDHQNGNHVICIVVSTRVIWEYIQNNFGIIISKVISKHFWNKQIRFYISQSFKAEKSVNFFVTRHKWSWEIEEFLSNNYSSCQMTIEFLDFHILFLHFMK